MDEGKTFVEPRIMQALSHPLRSEFLRLLAAEGTLSPKRAYGLLPSMETLSLSQMNYHIWSLVKSGLVKAGKADDRRAGTPFRATPLGLQVMTMIGAPSQGDAP
jgi:DNA-binding transcriptional ArsR family regulator